MTTASHQISKNDFVVYIDFDSTLFDTAAFSNDLQTIIAQKADITTDQVKANGADYFFHPRLGGYEFEKHVSSYGIDPVEMWHELDQLVGAKDYLYADSADFITSLLKDGYIPKILTFGESRFQRVKTKSVRSIIAIDTIVVDKKKNQYIATLHNNQSGVLLDDKPDQRLPAGFTEIHLHKQADFKTPRKNGDVITVSSLLQARAAIDQCFALCGVQ